MMLERQWYAKQAENEQPYISPTLYHTECMHSHPS